MSDIRQKPKGSPIAKAIAVGGILGTLTGFIPFIGLLISASAAGYMLRSKDRVESILVGIASGMISFAIWAAIYVSVPVTITPFITSKYASSLSHPALALLISSVSKLISLITLVLLISSFVAGPVGGMIGEWLANRKEQP